MKHHQGLKQQLRMKQPRPAGPALTRQVGGGIEDGHGRRGEVVDHDRQIRQFHTGGVAGEKFEQLDLVGQYVFCARLAVVQRERCVVELELQEGLLSSRLSLEGVRQVVCAMKWCGVSDVLYSSNCMREMG